MSENILFMPEKNLYTKGTVTLYLKLVYWTWLRSVYTSYSQHSYQNSVQCSPFGLYWIGGFTSGKCSRRICSNCSAALKSVAVRISEECFQHLEYESWSIKALLKARGVQPTYTKTGYFLFFLFFFFFFRTRIKRLEWMKNSSSVYVTWTKIWLTARDESQMKMPFFSLSGQIKQKKKNQWFILCLYKVIWKDCELF